MSLPTRPTTPRDSLSAARGDDSTPGSESFSAIPGSAAVLAFSIRAGGHRLVGVFGTGWFFACAVLLASVAFAGGAGAQAMRFDVTLDPGGRVRRDAPITVRLRVGEELSAAPAADVPWTANVEIGNVVLLAQAELARDPGGAVVGFDVRWVESYLSADAPARRRVVVRPSTPGEEVGGFRFEEAPGHLDLFFDDRPVWRHVTGETIRPYHHLYGLAGERFLTKGPGGLHPHHRGIFLGWAETRAGDVTTNFWALPESGRPRQEHAGYDEQRRTRGRAFARSVATARWLPAEGEAVVEDARDVLTWRLDDGWLLDLALELRALGDEVVLDGDPAHGGFQLRAAQEVAEGEACEYVLAARAEAGGEDDTWVDCSWVAARFPLGERRYEVMWLVHPENPGPTWMQTRAYGRFGAFFRATLTPGEPLRARYRVRVREIVGEPASREELDAAYEDWVDPVRAAVE